MSHNLMLIDGQYPQQLIKKFLNGQNSVHSKKFQEIHHQKDLIQLYTQLVKQCLVKESLVVVK